MKHLLRIQAVLRPILSRSLLTGHPIPRSGLYRSKRNLQREALLTAHNVLPCCGLSSAIATEIRDLLLNTPRDNPYDVLKATLIERTAASEQRRLQQLLTAEELGERKPTQLLRRMQQLLGEKMPATDGSIIKGLFMQRLPTNVRMVLASASERTPLEELAALADKIMEVASPSIATLVRHHMQRARWTACVRRTRPCGSKLQLCRQEQGLDGVDRAVETEADHVPHLNQESAGITAGSAMPLVGVPRHVRRRETTRPATSGDEFRWPSVESPVLRVRPLHKNEFPGRHGCRG